MAESLMFSSRKQMQDQHGFLAVHLSVLDLVCFFSFCFILTYKWPFTNTPEKKRKQWLKLEIEKKTDKFLFHKNLTRGTLQRSIFFCLSIVVLSFKSPFECAWSYITAHGPMEKTKPWRPKAFQASLSSFSPPSLLSSLLPLLSPSPNVFTFLCCVCVRSFDGERWWSGCLQGEVALFFTVVLTSTETCQARSLGLGQGQTLQERWVLLRWYQKWSLIGCSYVPAYEGACMFRSSARSQADW